MKNIYLLAVLTFSCLLLFGCGGNSMKNPDFSELKNIPQQKWAELTNKKIYFGHQSVGFNIIDGMNSIMKELSDIKLNIQETKDLNSFSKPVFAHSPVGENEVPSSKIYDFRTTIETGIGDSVDIAFFKLCYIDIMADTDVEKVFGIYKEVLTNLAEKYSDVTFVHVTAPVRTVQAPGPKTWIKKILGKPLGGYEDNIKRNQFNEMLKKAYEGKEPIFDLAAAESTFPNGSRKTFQSNGKTYYSLIPEYTDDGGHLTDLGQKFVAEKFLVFLANLSTRMK